METTTSPSPVIEIHSVRFAGDAAAARELLACQRQWLSGIGIDVATAQPAASDDYAEPARYYAPPDAALLVARLDGQPCGLVGLRPLPERPGEAELRRMFVLDGARGHGVGRQLLAAAIRTARWLGYAELWLETLPEHMPSAFHLYRSAGFRPASPLGHTALSGVVTMRLVLDRRPFGWPPAPVPSPRCCSVVC